MSLSSFLLGTRPPGKSRTIDTELDTIFNSQPAEDRPSSTSNDQSITEKRKKRRSEVHSDGPDKKRPKSSPTKEKETGKKRVTTVSAPEPGVEKRLGESSKSAHIHGSSSDTLDDTVEDDHQSTPLIHETLQQKKPGRSAVRKTKHAPSDETKERRDARTIFIGNLAPEVAVKRPLQKQLHRHILAFAPTAKIESTRFRSVAFHTPTSTLSEPSDEAKKPKQLRQHERDRASSWRDASAANESKTDGKKFLTPSQKKKIAFIHKDIHSEGGSVHAYIVFSYPPSHSRPANLPPLPPIMDPFEATRLVVEKCNGTVFLDRMLRVDTVAKQSSLETPSDSALPSSAIGDPKLSVFVGNLDFASKEEDLRVFFEGIVSTERGLPDPTETQGDKPKCWVTRVRLIRDKDTQLGKGFAYVQFADRTCVDEILALEPGRLKFAKRKLRVQRCRQAGDAPSSGKGVVPTKPIQKTHRASVPPVPKGDPSLGEKLVKLSKDERKRVKAADADRVARRMAKKKARIALAKQGVPVQVKQRERVRKPNTAKKLGAASAKKTSKGSSKRVRSEKSLAKRNIKK